MTEIDGDFKGEHGKQSSGTGSVRARFPHQGFVHAPIHADRNGQRKLKCSRAMSVGKPPECETPYQGACAGMKQVNKVRRRSVR